MNNEKLVDAIGLIDDKMIYDSKKTHRSYPLFLKRTIAALLIITLIPVALFGGLHLFGRFMFANSSDPAFKYSFKTTEILSICETSFNVEGNSTVGINPNSINNKLGANPIEIRYADDMRIIFTTQNGIFEYVRLGGYEYIESSYSLEKMKLPDFNQGDKTTIIQVDKNGDYAILISSENMSQANAERSYKMLNFVTGELTEINKTEIPETFVPFELTSNTYIAKYNDWLSSNMATCTAENGDKLECFIKVTKSEDKGYIIGNAELVEVNENGTHKIYKLFK